MYHGDRVPGFPQHPHRGFETVTFVLEGLVDHTDSLGQGGRYGGDGRAGDIQFMTAGSGVVHGEMMPLVHVNKPNTLRLFQLWLNLPKKDKFAEPAYVMTWAESMTFLPKGPGGSECQLAVGRLGAASAAAAPPPRSWAADPANDVGVFYVTLPPGSTFELPPAATGAAVNRVAYVVEGPTAGPGASVGGVTLPGNRGAFTLRGELPCLLENTAASGEVHVLVLQGRPIGEPVAQRGPFVMNTQAELAQASADYSRTRFGGWPWAQDAVVFDRAQGRFADVRQPDGSVLRTFPPAAASEAAAEL